MDAEGGPGVICVRALCAQPTALEQRADHVAPVAQRVDERRPWKRLGDRGQHEGRLGRLLHGAAAADEAETADAVENRPDLVRRDVRDRGFERVHFAKVGEAGKR